MIEQIMALAFGVFVVQRRFSALTAAAVAVLKNQHGISEYRAESAQNIQRRVGQGGQAVFVPFGITNMYLSTYGIETIDLQAQALPES